MWGQLAGRVAQSVKENAGDLRSTMARIGDVVAPPPGEEDEEYEEYEDDDDGDDEYEEEEYTDEEDDDEEDSNQPMAGGGLGALLSPFLDRKGGQKAQYDEEESEEEEAEEEDEEETWKESISSTKPQTYGEIETSNLTSSLSSSSATQPTSVQAQKAVPPTKTTDKVVDSSKKLIVSKASTHQSTAQNAKLSSTSRKEEGGAQRVALSNTEPKVKTSSSVPSNQRPKSGTFTQRPTQPRADVGSSKQEKAPEKQRPVGKLSNDSAPPNDNLASKGREAQAKRRAQTRDEKTGAGSVSSLKSQSHAKTANGKSTSSRPMSVKEMVSKKEPSQAVKPKQEKKDPRQAAKYQEKVSKKSGPTEMLKSGGKPTASSSSSSVKELVQPAIDTTRMVSSPAKPSKVVGDTSSPMVSYLMSDEPVDPNAKTPKASSTSPYMRQKTERKEPSPLLHKKTVAAATTASRGNNEPSKARTSHQTTTTQVKGKSQRKQQVSSTSQKSAETESPNKTLKPYAAQTLSIPDLNLQPDMDLTTRPAAEVSLTHLAESSERRVPSNVLHDKEPTQSKRDDEVSATKLKDLQSRYQRLERDLKQREQQILDLQRETAKRMEEEEQWRQSHVLKFKQEQAQMVEAMTESVTMEHRQAMRQQRQKHELEIQQMEEARDADAAQAAHDQAQLKRLLDEAQARIEATETDKKKALNKQGAMASQMQQRKEQAVRRAEEKLAETMAQVDMKQEEIQSLKKTVKELKATLAKKKRGEEEVEDELEHLRSENDTLHHNWQVTEEENEELKKQLEHFESRESAIKNLQEKLKKLENERVLEKAQKESAMSSAASNQANVEGERDAALAHCRDLEHQLTAALADVEVARADTDRALLGNANLNKALAAFQAERDAEMALWEEQRHSQEEATAAAHAAALEATHAANESKIREVKGASDRAVKAIQSEVSAMQSQLEENRKENIQLRRSLDEAIHRLQASQEDVVDRNMMKNVLLDWFAKTGKGKKDVLEVMASLLHFTDEEKEKVHIYDGPGTFGKVVGAVAAPLPPPAADVGRLEGSNVREKWVSFLLAETDEA